MSDETDQAPVVTVDIGEWVKRAAKDPEAYLERQATEVFLTALGMAHPFSHDIFLKGGILMGVVYHSHRQTGDIDFTAMMEPEPGIADAIAEAMAEVLPRAAAGLGYPDLMCAVQSSKYYPSAKMFPKADGPALKLRIGYARRGSRQAAGFKRGKASTVLEVDISFREPVGAIQIVRFGDTGGMVRAYSLYDLIAEKLRALLQQEPRNRYRRQDIYDLNALLARFALDDEEMRRIYRSFIDKCAARRIEPAPDSLSEPEVARRAQADWDSMELEIGDLPDFDACFARVDTFYRSLPWER